MNNKNFNSDKYYIPTLNYVMEFLSGVRIKIEKKNHIKIFEYLNKYMYALNNTETLTIADKKYSDIIWQCWLQGEDNMPDLVKVCTKSVKTHNPNRRVILITDENYNQFLDLPDYILNKYKKGIIPPAQFSDIIRLALLKKYGGVWLDSTIYLTDKLPEIAFSSEFFTYKNPIGLNIENVSNFEQLEALCNFINRPIMLPSSWFISSVSNNVIISSWLNLLLEYWKNENSLIDYFIMDYFFVLLIIQNDICRKIFTNIPVFLTTSAELLQAAMPEEFNEKVYETIKSMSPIHKLTLKYTPDNSVKNRFYNKIIKE